MHRDVFRCAGTARLPGEAGWMLPLALVPRPESRVWGGRGLEQFGRELPRGPVGESWEVHGDLEVVGKGCTLDELVRSDPKSLLGFSGDSFPLLAKWLDCHQWLSVQVHPDDRLAAPLRGKTECWFVRSVSGEARLIHGLLPGTRPEQLFPDARLLDFVDYRDVHEGDVFLTPAGTVHALGPGLLLYEIQQSSDLTYRMYDWDRPGLDGRPRPMHFEEAMRVLREVPPYLAPPVPDGTVGVVRVNTPFFVVEELLQGQHSWTPSRAEILTAFRGTGMVNGRFALEDGQALVLPASVGPVTVEASGMLLRTWIPPSSLASSEPPGNSPGN